MADEKITIATAANYWISQNALSIQLNALGEADRIQAGVASGAEIMVFIRGVKPASSGAEYDKNGDGLEYDNGHNYRHWPLTISPTYFSDSEVRYLYVAVPRSASVGTEAMVVFPSKKLDIYGYEVIETTSGQTTTVSRGKQLGSDDYFYIWLQAVISAVQTDKTPNYRKWLSPVESGYLNSDEAYSTSETSWYRWDPISQIVTFTKEIWMDAASWFQNLQAVDGLFKGQLTVKGLFDALMARIDKISSHDFVSGLLDGSGWRLTNDNGEGGSELEVDFLKVRKKATFMELEVRKETFVGGNQHYSPAGSIIYRVDYMDANDQALGYVSMKVPLILKGFAFLGKKAQNRILNYAAKKKVRRGLTDDEWPKVKYFRCYLLADDGTTATRNWWRAGDQVRCQTWNKAKSGNKSTNWWETSSNYHYNVEESVDATVASNTYYWRMVNKVGSARLEDNKVYDYIDLLYEGWSQATDANSYRAPGSDKPDAGDMIVCMGNRYDENRMNMISLYTTGNDNNPPAIKGYRGIHSFSLTSQNRVFEISPEEVLFRSKNFRFLNDNGYKLPPVLDRGEWVKGTRYHYYDRVSWKGSMWLCIINDDDKWQYANSTDARAADVTDITIEEGDFTYTMVIGGVTYTGTDHYSKRGKIGNSTVYYIRNYTTTEPSKNASGVWLQQVSKGTEITTTEVAYAASESGTAHPDDNATGTDYNPQNPQTGFRGWKTVGKGERTPDTDDAAINATGINAANHPYGIYLWTRKKTYYDDPNDPDRKPTVEYTVVRWGIDGDGISEINSYYLARLSEDTINSSNDNFPMPGDSGWNTAAANAKWFDTFSACAAANGGVGAMQGWLVWEKTVIKYDAYNKTTGKPVTKADLINYKSSRIGQDGQIGQEEYYMLAASDDFATVFPNSSGKTYPDYDKIGIRWYDQAAPATERWRLAAATAQNPNINTQMWSSVMPTYNKQTHGNKVYLWNFEQRIDGQGNEYATRPVCIGNHARGIKGVLELYALSAVGAPQTEGRHIPNDIWAANGNSETDYSHSDPSIPETWSDEIYDRAPTEALPYQWNWTRTLYSTKDAAGKDYEDHYHVSAVRGTRGEDGAGTEYIYCRTQANVAPKGYNGTTGTSRGTAISGKATVGGVEYDKCRTVDDFVPNDYTEGSGQSAVTYHWTDNPVGIEQDWPYEWVCERKSSVYSGTGGFTGGHIWSVFSAPVPRSKWGKNGVDGDGTEYVFIRTKTDVAPVLLAPTGDDYKSMEWRPYVDGTGRTDIETNGGTTAKPRCTDDPNGTTRDWPYEWAAKRNMGAAVASGENQGHRDWKSYYECMTDHKMSRWSTYTTLRLDIDNEMDMVPTDSTGKVTAARTVKTKVRLYDGGTEVNISAVDFSGSISGGPDVTSANKIATFGQQASGNGKELSWAFIAGKTMAAAYDITISYTYNNVPYTAVFTIAASMGQTIWQLKPSASAMAFSRNSSNGLTPPAALTLQAEILDGNTPTLITVSSGTFAYGGKTVYVRYSKSAMPTGISGTGSGDAWPGSVSVSEAEVTRAENPVKDVYIAMFTSDGVLLDRETVPIVKDGKNGTNIVRLDLDNENDTMLYNSEGTLKSGSVTSKAYMFDGALDVSDNTVFSISDREGVTAEQATIDTTTRIITVTGMSNNATKAKVTVQGVYRNSAGETHTKTAVLTIKKQVGGCKYWITASPSSVPYNATTDTPDTSTVYIVARRIDVDGNVSYVSEPAVYASAGTLTSTGTGTYQLVIDNSEVSEVTLRLASGPSASATVYDTETIPIVKCENGQSSFVSHVFKRQNSQPDAPTGGSYLSPVPSGWEDGVPDGSAMVWMSTRIFTNDGQSPQQSAWATPRQMTDTADFDVEYSTVATNPGNPTDNPANWSNTASSDTIWMATRECHNGVWSDWEVSKIKGENGDDAVVYTIECADTIKPGDTALNVKVKRSEGTDIQTKIYSEATGLWSTYLSASMSGGGTATVAVNGVTFSGTITKSSVLTLTLTIGQTTVATKVIRAVADGADGHGDPGHVGRWYYYAGDWAGLTNPDGTSRYWMEPTQSPYVRKGGNFYMLDFNGNPDAQNSNQSYPATTVPDETEGWEDEWSVMNSAFKYYIAEAIFSNNAYLGSFIINGDWMISQWGDYWYGDRSEYPDVINTQEIYDQWVSDNGRPPYSAFLPAYVNTGYVEYYSHFCPYFAVDGKTGKTYQNDAYVRGQIVATGGTIGGFNIGADDLTNTNYSAGITIKDNSDMQVVKIGADAIDSLTGESAAMVAKATEVKDPGSYNTALYLMANNASYNYAFHGYGNGVLNGYIQGYRVNGFSVGSNDVQLELNKGMVQAITSVTGNGDVCLPQLWEIQDTLCIKDGSYFCCELILINQSSVGNSGNVTVKGGTHAYNASITDPNTMPKIYRKADTGQVVLDDKETVHFFITYINNRFLANYILG